MGNLATKLIDDVAQMQSEIASLKKAVAKLSRPSGADRGKASGKKEAELLQHLLDEHSEPQPFGKLRKALDEHYADFANSSLAELSRKLFNNAKIKNLCKAWATHHKEPSVLKWATAKTRNNAKILAWYKG